jgi:hypothetical protein
MRYSTIIRGILATTLGLSASFVMAQDLTAAQVTTKLEAAGYTKVHGIEKEGTHFDADAMKDGKAVHLHVDAKSGAIAVANNEHDEEEEEEHEQHKP